LELQEGKSAGAIWSVLGMEEAVDSDTSVTGIHLWAPFVWITLVQISLAGTSL